MVEKFKKSWSLISHVTNSLSQRKVQARSLPLQILFNYSLCVCIIIFFQSISFNPKLHLPHHSFLQGGGTIWVKAHWHERNKKNCFNMLARLFSNFFFQLDDSNDNWERERERICEETEDPILHKGSSRNQSQDWPNI